MEQVNTVPEAVVAIEAKIESLAKEESRLEARLSRVRDDLQKQRTALDVLQGLNEQHVAKPNGKASDRMPRGGLRVALVEQLNAVSPDGLGVSELCQRVGDAHGKTINPKSADNALRALKENGEVYPNNGHWFAGQPPVRPEPPLSFEDTVDPFEDTADPYEVTF